MQPPMSRHTFSYGFTTSRSTRLTLLTLGALLTVPAAGCVGAILGVGIGMLLEGDAGTDGRDLIAVPIILICLLAGGVLTWFVINIITVAKMGAWLEGTRLTVRERRRQTVDLSRARSVALQPSRIRWKTPQTGVATSGFVPEVVATGQDGVLRMRLCDGERVPLPPQDLYALASGLSTVQAPGAAEVTQHLQLLASGRAVA